jgi:dipeptidyl aminopeptidase/acylaminoacyl peptidase
MKNGPVQAHLTDSLFVRHWTEYNDGKYSHIFLYDLEKKNYKDLTPGFYNSPTFSPGGSNDYSFSPDSKKIIFSSKRVNNPESSTDSDVWSVSIDGTNLTNLTKANKAYDGNAKFSPNGKYIAYLTQLVPGYESDKRRLALLNIENGKSILLTEEIDNNVNDFEWTSDSKAIYFTIDEKGYNPILKVDIYSNKISYVMKGKSLHGFILTPDDKNIIYKYSYVHQPAELGKLNLQKNEDIRITNINKAFTDSVDVRKAEQLWIPGAEGAMIQVFLVKPHDFNPAEKYPLIINVHGGPQMQWRDSFRGDWQIYPGAGYVLAFPNPHGSTGFGKEFTKDISKHWDGNVYKDVMAVMDSLQNLPYVDKKRMGAMGWSYGGYFMNLLQARGNRFKCLASMMGIYDLEQFYLETEELWFPNYDLNGNPWDNKELYDKQSPSKFVDNFKTPALIITGEKDYRVSYTQSLRYFTTLQIKGIDSRLIIFKNDGHWPSYVRSMPLYYNAHLEWFHKYLGGKKAPYDSKQLVKNLTFDKN